LSKSANFYAF